MTGIGQRDLAARGGPSVGSTGTGADIEQPDDKAPCKQCCEQQSNEEVEEFVAGAHGDCRGEEEDHRKAKVPAGGAEACKPVGEIFHAGFSLRVSGLALGTFFGALACLPVGRGTAWGVAVVCLYPVTTGLFYFVYRRIGERLGAPLRLGNAGLGLVFLAWLFLCSGDAAAQRLAFLAAAAAAFAGGASLGEGLAVIATGRGTGFRGAFRSMQCLSREARRRCWLGAVSAAKGEIR